LSSIVYAKNHEDELMVFPNPVKCQVAYFNYEVTGAVFNLTGQQVLKFESASQISVGDLDAGIYILKTTDAVALKIIIQ